MGLGAYPSPLGFLWRGKHYQDPLISLNHRLGEMDCIFLSVCISGESGSTANSRDPFAVA